VRLYARLVPSVTICLSLTISPISCYFRRCSVYSFMLRLKYIASSFDPLHLSPVVECLVKIVMMSASPLNKRSAQRSAPYKLSRGNPELIISFQTCFISFLCIYWCGHDPLRLCCLHFVQPLKLTFVQISSQKPWYTSVDSGLEERILMTMSVIHPKRHPVSSIFHFPSFQSTTSSVHPVYQSLLNKIPYGQQGAAGSSSGIY
jgi:hypothetical protein